ncbi:MAG: energy transducer TonB [Acidobacteriaceae bacterium]
MRLYHLALVPLIFAVSFLHAEDPQLRQEAVRLMERAAAASTAPTLPNVLRTDHFRSYSLQGNPQEGSFTRAVVQHQGRRDEYTFGDYHDLEVLNGRQISFVRTSKIAPPAVYDLLEVAPIRMMHFDEADTIRSIAKKTVNGRSATCIEFESTSGEKTQLQNEFCLDSENGTLLREKVGDTLVENSNFFPFAGVLMPGNIRYSVAGALKMEVTQTMQPLTTPVEEVLATPPHAEINNLCSSARRPFGTYMPQPKPGHGSNNYDVVLHGMVETDGKVHDAVVEDSERPDLNAEALSMAQQWTYTPEICNGHPNPEEVQITIHFIAR